MFIRIAVREGVYYLFYKIFFGKFQESVFSLKSVDELCRVWNENVLYGVLLALNKSHYYHQSVLPVVGDRIMIVKTASTHRLLIRVANVIFIHLAKNYVAVLTVGLEWLINQVSSVKGYRWWRDQQIISPDCNTGHTYIHNWPLEPFSQVYWPSFSHHLCCVC